MASAYDFCRKFNNFALREETRRRWSKGVAFSSAGKMLYLRAVSRFNSFLYV